MAENKAAAKRLEDKMNKEKDLGDKLKDYDGDPDAMAMGGRIGFNRGSGPGKGIMNFIRKLSEKSPAQRYKDYLASVKKRSIEGDFKSLAPELAAISSGGILVNRKMKRILEEGNEQQKERFLKEYIEELNNDPSYKDRPELKDKLIANYTESLFGQKKAMGGIISLKNGGPPNPGRRSFMKLMAGLASIPVLGKLFKPAKIASKVVPLQNTTTTMPAWFPQFVDKVVNKGVGKKIDADLMQYEVKELPGIKVTKADDGRVFVEGKNDYYKSYEIDYTPPGYEVVDEKTGKAVKTKGDFMAQEEVPVNVDPDGNADFDGEVLESVDNILSSDARAMEEFATGKTIKEMKSGEYSVGRAEALADAARKGEDFSEGGIAYMLGE